MKNNEKITNNHEVPFKTKRTSMTYVKPAGEIFTSPSITVPEQAYTPAELIIRHTRGLPMPKLNNMVWSDIPIDDTRKLDLTEIDEVKKTNAYHIDRLKKDLDAKEAMRRKQRQEILEYRKKEADIQKNKTDNIDGSKTDNLNIT